jgi:hypothetical protein
LRRKEERVKKITKAKQKKTIVRRKQAGTRNDHKVKAGLPVRFARVVYAAFEGGLMSSHRA